jgi:hypothetical protein
MRTIEIFFSIMKKYKGILAITFAATILVACNTLTTAERAERDAKTAMAVEAALNERHYTVEIEWMYPISGRARYVLSDFMLEVRGDTLLSYLPYFGRAYDVPYGGGKGMNFVAPITHYQSAKSSNGTTEISMMVDNDEDILQYRLKIFNSGKTNIDVESQKRETISYSGTMVLK